MTHMSLPRHFPALLFALAQLCALDGALANHFILPCTTDCDEPRWVATGSMQAARELHTATLLSTGKVLVAGGRDFVSGPLDSAELYDPGTGTWSATGRMTMPRFLHTATLLVDGRVLVAGGANANSHGVTASAEIYDPATGTWAPTGSMIAARCWYDAALLQDGRVLVAGGWGHDNVVGAELYDPETGRWTPTGALNVARYGHTLTPLHDGTVLAVRGSNSGDLETTVSGAERFDPHTGTWSLAGESGVGSVNHTASVLPDGRVLVAGGDSGFEDGSTDYAAAYVFDPMTSAWDRVGDLRVARQSHAAIVLPGGGVLVAGGSSYNRYSTGIYTHLAATERFEPETSMWTRGTDLVAPRARFTLTLLRDGTILAAGGSIVPLGYSNVPLATAERYSVRANASGSDHGTGDPDCEHGRACAQWTTWGVPPP